MIVDFHTHVFPEWLRDQREKYVERDAIFGELYASPRAKMATVKDLLLAMDGDSVDTSIAMGIGWTDQGLAREVNDYIIMAVKEYPDRIVGFAGINTRWGDEALREAERCARAGLRGIGELHPYSQGFDLGDKETMAPLMEVVREYDLIVSTHSSEPVGHLYTGKGQTRPEVLWRFIRSFPNVTLVCAHWGGGLPFYALMPEVKEGLRNVYFDTAASPFLYRRQVFSVGVSLVGADRILLASDFPLLRAHRLLRQISGSPLSEVDKDAIMGGNAARLLGLD